jgi:hypothetical protein
MVMEMILKIVKAERERERERDIKDFHYDISSNKNNDEIIIK